MGNARNIAFWVVLFLLILALFNLFSGGQTTMSSRSISLFRFHRSASMRARCRASRWMASGSLIRAKDGNQLCRDQAATGDGT